MSTTSETAALQRQILLVGPYGVRLVLVLSTPSRTTRSGGVTTAAGRPAPAYRAQSAPPHISVDLMDREGTKNAFSSLGEVTDLVSAAYVEKPAMAGTVEPNASMLKNALGALAAGSVPVRRVVLAGGAKSYGFSLGSSSDVLLCTDLSKSSAEGPLVSLMRNQEDQ
ncbi:hypothetical protein [Mycobacterium sp.]|uniref:hypothetical protein n=1 Tax=Mycobacterium sp. TaxID=1785 RepID=UPI0026356859|nr:hypothetical protein [Mycobacterium sp.]